MAGGEGSVDAFRLRKENGDRRWGWVALVLGLAAVLASLSAPDAGPASGTEPSLAGADEKSRGSSGENVPWQSANEWTSPDDGPAPRTFTAMAYDSQSHRTVLFGGSPISGDTWIYDLAGNSWTLAAPLLKPSARMGHALAYDSQSDRVILFGGRNAQVDLNDTWAYDLDADVWTEVFPSSQPAARAGHAMAYDSESDRVVLFGGAAGRQSTNETWAFDFNAGTWTDMTGVVAPGRRGGTAMAYDSSSDRIVLYGGFSTGFLEDTWLYDLNGNAWSYVFRSPWPLPRYAHSMAYDAQSDRVVLFGGSTAAGGDWNATWTYDTDSNTWRKMAPAQHPTRRLSPAMAYDASSDRVVLFGGDSGTELGDTQAYDANGDSWSVMKAGVRPSARNDAALAYDAQSQRTVLFGATSELWAYDATADAWSLPTVVAPVPWQRAGHTMTYDPAADRIVLFGGWRYLTEFSNETWTYDYDAHTWSDVSTVPAPSPRGWHSAAFDAQSSRLIVFGGEAGAGPLPSETWAFDLANRTWTDMRPASGPSPRSGHAAAYDPESGRVIIYGGRTAAGQPTDETWAYDYRTNTWTDVSPATSPPPLAYAGLASDEVRGRLLLFGGETASGPTDETWAFDPTTDSWARLDPLTKPSPRSRHALAYDASADRVVVFGGEGDWSFGETWEYRSPDPPSEPRSVTASAGDARASLIWSPPVSSGGAPVIGYRVWRGPAPGLETVLADIGAALTYSDTGLANGQMYYYQITARNAAAEGARSEEAAATPVALEVTLTANRTLGTAPLAIAFHAEVSGGRAPYELAWDFGNGDSGTGSDLEHTYPAGGQFRVSVTVRDADDAEAQDGTDIVVRPPLALEASADRTEGTSPLTVVFAANATGGSPPYEFQWEFGDGGTGGQQTPLHAYSRAGEFSATVVVTDSDGRTVSRTLVITVRAPPGEGFPTALLLLAGVAAAIVVAAIVVATRRRRRVPAPKGEAPGLRPTPVPDARIESLTAAFREGSLSRALLAGNLAKLLGVPPSPQRDTLIRAFNEGRVDERLLERNLRAMSSKRDAPAASPKRHS